MRGKWSKIGKAQQEFYRARHKIWDLMDDPQGREFMMQAVDPDPLIDWDTGLTFGDPCPEHPEHKLSELPVPMGTPAKMHFKCSECKW